MRIDTDYLNDVRPYNDLHLRIQTEVASLQQEMLRSRSEGRLDRVNDLEHEIDQLHHTLYMLRGASLRAS